MGEKPSIAYGVGNNLGKRLLLLGDATWLSENLRVVDVNCLRLYNFEIYEDSLTKPHYPQSIGLRPFMWLMLR